MEHNWALKKLWLRGSRRDQTAGKPFHEPHSRSNLAQEHPNDHNSRQKFLQIIVSLWVPHIFHYKSQCCVVFQYCWASTKQDQNCRCWKCASSEMIKIRQASPNTRAWGDGNALFQSCKTVLETLYLRSFLKSKFPFLHNSDSRSAEVPGAKEFRHIYRQPY